MLNKKQTGFSLPVCSFGVYFTRFGVGMRKVLSLLVLIIMLFSLSSCDGMIDFMGKMGGNIMGTDTSGATEAAENATLSSSDIKTVEEDERIVQKEDGKTELQLGSVSVEVDMSGIESILPPIGATVVDDIASAIRNDESTKVLVEQMGKEVTDESVKTAAQGTAQVMNNILLSYKDSITGAVGNEGGIATAVSDALSSIENSLNEITKEGATITAGDVVTLQLVESFATDVASVVDEEGNIDENKISSLISSANTLATVTSSLSSTTKFSLDLESIISSVMDAIPEDENTRKLSRTTEESEEKSQIIKNIESYDLTPYVAAIRSVFKSISDVVGSSEDSFERNILGLGLHKATYETYVNIVYPFIDSLTGSDKTAYDSFKSFDGFFKYVVASLLSELDRYYDILINDDIVYNNIISITPELASLNLKNHNIWFIIEECVKAEGNRWITDSSVKQDKYYFDVPDEYEALVVSVIKSFNDEENTGASQILGDRVMEIFQSPLYRIPMVSALYTIDKMIDIVSLTSITNLVGDVDFDGMLNSALEFFGVEVE